MRSRERSPWPWAVPPIDNEYLQLVVERPKDVLDWCDVPDAPEALHDFPLDCTFCGEFVPIEADEPLRMVVTSWKNPTVQQLHVAHRACLDGATVTPRAAPPAPD